MAAVAIPRARLSRISVFASAAVGLPGAVLRRRRVLGQLGDLDERMLRDIGLTRFDVASAAAEPLFRDPTLMLVQRAEDRRQAVRAAARERLAFANLVRMWTDRDRAA